MGALLSVFLTSKEMGMCPQLGGFEIVFWFKGDSLLYFTACGTYFVTCNPYRRGRVRRFFPFFFFFCAFDVGMQALVTLLTSLQILAFSLCWEASCILFSFHDGAVLVNRENMYEVCMQVLANWSLCQVLSAYCLAEDGEI